MENIIESLKEELSSMGYESTIVTVPKNNATKTGITLTPGIGKLSATYYEDMILSMQDQGVDVKDIASYMIEQSRMTSMAPEFDVSYLSDPDFLKDHAYLTLVNYDWNQDMLKDSVWCMVPGTDLAAVVRIQLTDEMSFRLTKEHTAYSGIDEDEIREAAMEHTMDKDYRIMTMAEALGLPPDLNIGDMYVITLPGAANGASAMLSRETLDDVRERIGSESIYVIPSSIHEIIAISASVGDSDSLTEMITTINANEVSPEERLSDHPYVYDGKSLSMDSMAKKQERSGKSR